MPKAAIIREVDHIVVTVRNQMKRVLHGKKQVGNITVTESNVNICPGG